MTKTYSIAVYDCSFVQDYAHSYTRFFDSEDKARKYAIELMDDFSYRGLYEYTVEISRATHCKGQYQTFGYWEFDCLSYDGDLTDNVDELTNDIGTYSYHDMF